MIKLITEMMRFHQAVRKGSSPYNCDNLNYKNYMTIQLFTAKFGDFKKLRESPYAKYTYVNTFYRPPVWWKTRNTTWTDFMPDKEDLLRLRQKYICETEFELKYKLKLDGLNFEETFGKYINTDTNIVIMHYGESNRDLHIKTLLNYLSNKLNVIVENLNT